MATLVKEEKEKSWTMDNIVKLQLTVFLTAKSRLEGRGSRLNVRDV